MSGQTQNGRVRVCVITGSASGIGAACAREFARQGWAVALNYFGDMATTCRALDEECRNHGADTLVASLDVTQDSECQGFVREVNARWGRIDALINCAGTTRFIPHEQLDELDCTEFHRIYDVNVVGMYQMIRASAPSLRASGGAVVNISSVAGDTGKGSSIAYAASKGAVNTMTRSLARVLAPEVRVNAIAPGFVSGGLSSRLMSPEANVQWSEQIAQAAALKRVSTPEEIAVLASFLVTGAPGMTGEIVTVDNGWRL